MISKRAVWGVFLTAYRHVTLNQGTWIDVVAIQLQEGVFLRSGCIRGENFHLRGGEAGNTATVRKAVRQVSNQGLNNSFRSHSHYSPLDVDWCPREMAGRHARDSKPLKWNNS